MLFGAFADEKMLSKNYILDNEFIREELNNVEDDYYYLFYETSKYALSNNNKSLIQYLRAAWDAISDPEDGYGMTKEQIKIINNLLSQ